MTDEPLVTIDLGASLCSFHALPWKPTWPDSGAMVAVMRMFDALVADPEVRAEAGENDEAGTKADVRELTNIIRRRSPLCCWFAKHDPEVLVAAYSKAGVEPPRWQG